MLRREVPESIRPRVCGAVIMAFRKPNGSLRPIAIGETIRRLTSKVAVDLITERAREIFEPLQLGVKSPNERGAIIHVARQWFSRSRTDPDKVAVSVDVSNAFNTVHRAAVLRAVRVHFRPFLHGSTVVTATKAPCSPGAFSKVIPSVRFSSL